MANFNTLAEVQTSTSGDFYHLQQGGIDYKHTRETLAGAIANARWSNTFTYTLGSEVVGSDNEKYVAVASSTGEDPSIDNGTYWRVLSRDEVAPNKVKTSQFVVEGTTGNPLPENGTLEDYPLNSEIALGWVVTTACEQITKDANGNVYSANNTGAVRYTINKSENETPLAAQIIASVMRCTDSATGTYVQDYSDGSNGISVSESTTEIYIDIDFSDFAGGVVFGASEQLGKLEILSEEEVAKQIGGLGFKQKPVDVTLSRAAGLQYTNGARPIFLSVSLDPQASKYLIVDGENISLSSTTGTTIHSFVVPPYKTYEITAGATFTTWTEMESE